MEYNLCRCCLSKGLAKDLYTSYVWLDKNENYSEMLQECFNIVLSRTENGSICERCVGQLRGALRFKEQVLKAELELAASLQHLDLHGDLFEKMEPKDEGDSDEFDDIFLSLADADPRNPPELLQPQDSAVSTALQREKEGPITQEPEEEAGVTPECSHPSPGEGPRRSGSLERQLAVDTCLVRLTPIRVEDLQRESCHIAFDSEPCLGNHNDTADEESSEPTPPSGDEAALERTLPCPREPHSLEILEQCFELRSCSVRLQRILPGNLHTCEPCHVTFDCESGLTRHNRSRHTADKPAFNNGFCYETFGAEEIRHVICDVCGKRFECKKHLISHLATHLDLKQCDTEFARISLLTRHAHVHAGQKPFSCEICDEGFTRSSHLARHKFKIHKNKTVYTCDICQKRFTKKNHLTIHSRIHTRDEQYFCDMCDKQFSRKRKLTRHKKIHKGENCLFSCNVCNYRFRYKRMLIRHKGIHTGEKPYCCDLCDKRFTFKRSLTRHLLSHTGDKPYSCDLCEKKFTYRSLLNKHITVHGSEKPYSCNLCGKRFKNQTALKEHLKIHTGEKPYSCDVCGKRFARRPYLIRHITVHAIDKLYSCDSCEKRFKNGTDLARHLKIHTGEKPHCCDLCDKRFLRKPDLISHIRVHTGEKPYSCNMCQKRFGHSADLTRHIRTHTGEKPYSCEICDKRFIQKTQVAEHLRTHMGKKIRRLRNK